MVNGDIGKAHEVIIDDITGPEGINPLGSYLGPDGEASREYVLDDAILAKNWAAGLSIVGREDRCTFCFTSSYGKVTITYHTAIITIMKLYEHDSTIVRGQTFHRSSGSILHTEEPRGRRVVRAADMSGTHSDKMRLFTPQELLRIFGFPDDFAYPPGMSTKHMYKCIGQSINVVVVRSLMHAVLCAAKDQGVLAFSVTRDALPKDNATASEARSCIANDSDAEHHAEYPTKKPKCSEL
jgi:hypothetical protein